jgi:hypothetical protein
MEKFENHQHPRNNFFENLWELAILQTPYVITT